MAKTATKNNKKKVLDHVAHMRLSIFASFNNTIITASDALTGKVIAWTSSGQVGFKGAKKGTPYAATMAMKQLLDKLIPLHPETVVIDASGAGNGRDAALRALSGTGLKVGKITDTTPLPHNGCRPKKVRKP